jgi:hypothetical protein
MVRPFSACAVDIIITPTSPASIAVRCALFGVMAVEPPFPNSMEQVRQEEVNIGWAKSTTVRHPSWKMLTKYETWHACRSGSKGRAALRRLMRALGLALLRFESRRRSDGKIEWLHIPAD